MAEITDTLREQAGLVAWLLAIAVGSLSLVIKVLWSRLQEVQDKRAEDKNDYVRILEKNVQTLESLKILIQNQASS